MANFLKSLFIKGVEIDTTGASTGNVLSYNGTKFAPAAPGSGSLALDDLSDVVITAPEEFQGLSYNGTSWVNSHIPLVSYVRNAETTTITTGTCVYLFGATGDHATVKRADNNNDSTSAKTIGVAGANITASNNGPVVTRGYVDGIDLSTGYTAGDILWLGENGAFTTTKPTAPDHLVFIGVVVRATNNGIIYVATQNGYELDELHNVSLPSPNSGEYLKYNGSLWVADAIDLGTDTTGNYMSGISGTSPVSVSHTPSEGSSATVSLASGYGDTQNPYTSKTANFFLAAPNGSAGAPTFRAVVAADIPTLNQSTTGNAATATTLQTSRNINGVAFNGSADITVTAAAGTLTGTTLASGVTASSLTSVGTLSSLSITGDLTVDTNTLRVDSTNNRVGVNVTSPAHALDVIGRVETRAAATQDGVAIVGRAGGTSSFDVTITPTTLGADRTFTLPNVSGTAITTGNLTDITTVGTLSSGSIPATLLTGTVASARISGSYTGITAVGTLSGLSSSGTISGTNYTASSNNYYVTNSSSSGTLIDNGNLGYTGANADSGMPWCTGPALGGRTGWAFYNQVYGGWRMGYRCNTGNTVRYMWCADYTILGSTPDDARATDPLVVVGNGRVTDSLFFTNYIVADDGVASSGQAAQWLSAFGNYYLVRNTSTLRDKENVQPLGSHLTASMIDDIEVKLWSRKNSNGIPEVGPIAEEMEAVSPFLGIRGMDLDEAGNVVPTPVEGINQNSWLSLLTVALQDAREQIKNLTDRLAVLESN